MSIDYLLVRTLHAGFAAASGSGFLLRLFWMQRGSPLLQHRLTRILPHIIDTALLACAVILMVQSGQYPLAQGWLTAKVIALLAYIVLGSIALKRGRTPRARALAAIGAVASFAWIVKIAITKQVLW